MSPTSASSRAGADGPMPVSSSNVEPRSVTNPVSSFLMVLIFLSMPSSSTINSTASRRRVLPTRSLGLVVAMRLRACGADRNCFAPPGNSSSRSRCSRLTVCVLARRAHRDGRPTSPSPPGRHQRPPGQGQGQRLHTRQQGQPSAHSPGPSYGRCRSLTPSRGRTASAAHRPRTPRRARAGARCAGRSSYSTAHTRSGCSRPAASNST